MRVLFLRKLPLISILLIASNSLFAQAPAVTTPAVSTPAVTVPAATPPPAPVAAPPPAPTPKTVPAATTTAVAPAPAAPRPKAPAAMAPKTDEPPAGYTGPVWKKQVTRDIEMNERIDTSVHRLRSASAENTLLEMFAIGIKTGRISSFYTSEFSMATRIKVTDFDKLFVGRIDTTAERNAAGKYVMKVYRRSFNYSDVHKYRIKEEWTSYPGIGKSEIQIVGIAPLKDIKEPNGTVRGVEPLFWVHYTEDIKLILARYDQYNPNNTLGGHIWNDYFTIPAPAVARAPVPAPAAAPTPAPVPASVPAPAATPKE